MFLQFVLTINAHGALVSVDPPIHGRSAALLPSFKKELRLYLVPRTHSSRTYTARLLSVCAWVATRCQYHGKGPQVNNFEQISSDDRQMSLEGDPEVNKFEQVSSDGHQMSLAEVSHLMMGPDDLVQ